MNNEIIPYPEVKSRDNECKRLVVFLHGLGSDGHDLIGLVPFLAAELPDCHFISPHAVEAFEGAPYGRQWFSIHSCTPEILAKNIKLLENIIQDKQKQLNLTNKDTIIIGFSQGTMIGLHLNFLQQEPFYAVVGFSGRLIPHTKCILLSDDFAARSDGAKPIDNRRETSNDAGKFISEEYINKITPICLVHGELDDIVDISSMEEIIEYLQKHSISYSSYKVPDLMHTIDSRGLTFALKFIKEH